MMLSKPERRPRREHNPLSELTFAEGRRRVSLGSLYEKIKNTTLENQREMNALVNLKRGWPEEAAKLAQLASEGHVVSAVAAIADKRRAPPPTADEILAAWRLSHKVISVWRRAAPEVRLQFINILAKEDHHA